MLFYMRLLPLWGKTIFYGVTVYYFGFFGAPAANFR